VEHLQLDALGTAVLRRVREQFRGAEVSHRLDDMRRALGQVDDQFDRQVAACREAGEGGTEAFVQCRWMDAPGQVTQFGDRLHRSAAGGVDQL
jgi:hypothetical protein